MGHRTDGYSLGATLYELLTLQPPFTDKRRDEVIVKILYGEARSPRHLNRSIPKDLETICLKALDRNPDQRYSSADELRDDLRRFLHSEAIQAKSVGWIGKATK